MRAVRIQLKIAVVATWLLRALNLQGEEYVNKEWFGDYSQIDHPVEVIVPFSDAEKTELIFDIYGFEMSSTAVREGMEIEIPGEGHCSVVGVPSLPRVSRLVAIPARAKVELEVRSSQLETIEGIEILPTMKQPVYDLLAGEELVYNEEIYQREGYFPEEITELSEPGIMRDLRVVRVTVNPVRYNPVTKSAQFIRHFEITLRYVEGESENIKVNEAQKLSRSFAPIYQNLVVNYDHLNLDVDEEWGTLLVIAPNNATVLSQIQPLVDWKSRKGISTVVANTSQTGTSSTSIKAYIQQAYNTWAPKLEYLIMIGDTEGSIAVAASNSTGDHNYSQLEGNDILADIAVGRFSCGNNTHLMTEVNKVVTYESQPYMASTSWYKKGAVCTGSGSGISTIQTKQTIRFKALLNGYFQVDTTWYNMPGSNITTFTNNSINAGIGFYNFRGYLGMGGYSISNIANLSNFYKLPFVTTITCGTGDIVGPDSDYPEEFFRVGTPTVPKGAIGAIGTATWSTHTRYNNCVDTGIYGGFFDYDIFQMGYALVSGKYDLYMSYPDNPSEVQDFSFWNNLIGDPSCMLWTDIPSAMAVDYPDTLPVGTTSIAVSVEDSVSGNGLSGVDICLKGTGLYLFALSDEDGEAFFNLPDLSAGTYLVTCSKHNYKPHLGQFIVQVAPVFVSYDSLDIDDDNSGSSSGNGDGNINPGETIELGLSLKNYGNSTTATNISVNATVASGLVTLIDPSQNFPNLGPGAVSAVIPSLVFSVSQAATNGLELPFNLAVTSSQGGWSSYMPVMVVAPEVIYQSHIVQDANGRLDPGDMSPVLITLMNNGGLTGTNISATLSTSNGYITTPTNPSAYGNMAPQQTASGSPFIVTVSPLIVPGTIVHFDMNLTGGNGYSDSTGFDLVVGSIGEGDPSGPDDYGYYALDNTDDGYSGYPHFDWIELDPNYGGQGTIINLTDFGNEQDDTELSALPFNFRYYGQEFNQISVCSNGWLAFGNLTYFTDFRNWYIPSTLGPYSLVSPFWDDLYLPTNPPGRVYKYYNETEHKFIVEWSRVLNRAPSNPMEVFEVVLYDPEYYPTSTGDGEILFQYLFVLNVQGQSVDNHYATVGIKSNDNLMGLEYSYWNYYAPGAAELANGRAIKFTTNIPVNLSPPVIVHTPIPDVLEPMPGYLVGVHISSWTAINYDSIFVYWSTSASGPFNSVLLTPVTSAIPFEYIAYIPEQQPGCGVYYYIYAQDIMGSGSYLPENAPNSTFLFLVGPQVEVVFDDAETETGWSLGVPGDDATTGIWIRDDPVLSVADNGHTVQPEDDHTPAPGHICFVTGNADPGDPAGTNDVDGGKTTLMSPVYNLAGVNFPTVSYWYWYTNNQGLNPNEDEWKVDVSNNGGSSWTNVLTTTESTPEAWSNYEFALTDYITPTSQVRFRFIASDYNGGSLIEACVDDFEIVGLDTTWGNPGQFECVPASEVSISFEVNTVSLSWPAVPGAQYYQIYQGSEPGFSAGEGELVTETGLNNVALEVTNSVQKRFYQIRIVR